MKLALLGLDLDQLALVQEIAASREHDVVAYCEVGEKEKLIRSLFPEAQLLPHWELLLENEEIEALLVSAPAVVDPASFDPNQDASPVDPEELRTEQLRKLVARSTPLVSTHPLTTSMIVYYELDMIRRESGCRMTPLLSWRLQKDISELADPSSPTRVALGPLEEVVLQRSDVHRDRGSVLRHFSRDADLARRIVGEVTKLHAMGGQGESPLANLGVQMTGPAGVLARWSIARPDQAMGLRMTVVGATGRAVLQIPDRGVGQYQLQTADSTDSFELTSPAASLVLDELMQPESQAELTWTDACRSLELTDAIDRSLKRGRTIELHREDFSEAGTFKGIMTSVGCGLLMVGMFLLVAIAVVDQIARKAGLIWLADFLRMVWPMALAAIFGIYLFLQLFLYVAPPSRNPRSEGQSDANHSPGDGPGVT